MHGKEKVKAIVGDLFFSGTALPVDDQDSLLETGEVDSLGMMNLVAALEKEFAVKVDIFDLVPDNFDSIERIVAYLEKRNAL